LKRVQVSHGHTRSWTAPSIRQLGVPLLAATRRKAAATMYSTHMLARLRVCLFEGLEVAW
jgi:hypothetical protein